MPKKIDEIAPGLRNAIGRYSFELDESLAGEGLRPLRDPAEIGEHELFA